MKITHQLKRNDMGEESNVLRTTPFYYLLLSIRDGIGEQTAVILK